MPKKPEPATPTRLDALLQHLAEGGAPAELRQEAAEALAEAVGRMSPAQAWVDALHRLAADDQPPVRRAVAAMLPELPEKAYAPLAGLLVNDPNRYVRDTAAKAIERRGEEQRKNRKRRKEVADFRERYGAFEAKFGPEAARQARRLGNQQFDALIGGTLHDVVNILAPMHGDLKLMQRHLENDPPSPAACRMKVGRFLHKIECLQAFMEDMRTYARVEVDAERRRRAVIADIARDALALARESLRAAGTDIESVAVEVDVPDSLRASLCPRLATTALMHLIRNGLDSLTEGAAAENRRLAIRARPHGDGGVCFTVEDNGPGIDLRTLEELRAFAPGKTTRRGRGTGFGIPTANRYAEAHGGRLDIESQPGKGAVFILTLPASEETTV